MVTHKARERERQRGRGREIERRRECEFAVRVCERKINKRKREKESICEKEGKESISVREKGKIRLDCVEPVVRKNWSGS